MRYHQLLENIIPATPENITKAKEFVFRKWQERAKELERPEPKDLSSSCKFGSLFAQKIFGGKLQGNYDHQYVVLANGQIIDFSHDAADVQKLKKVYYHDSLFWNNPDHRESMKSCLPRVNKWVDEFNSMRYQLSEDSQGGSTELIMKLDPQTFDQTAQGWRSLVQGNNFEDAIQALRAYIKTYVRGNHFINPPEGEEKWDNPGLLFWHLGQLLAMQNKYKQAAEWMTRSKNADDPDPEWDNYVDATLAFFKGDRVTLNKISGQPNYNSNTIKRLAQGVGKSYKQVYEQRLTENGNPVVEEKKSVDEDSDIDVHNLRIDQLDKLMQRNQGKYTFNIRRRALNVANLIRKGAIFVTYPHSKQGWMKNDKRDWSYSLITLYNVHGLGWAAQSSQYKKPNSYQDAIQTINHSLPNLGNTDLVYDNKYLQILWSAKKLGLNDRDIYLTPELQEVVEKFDQIAEIIQIPPLRGNQDIVQSVYNNAISNHDHKLPSLPLDMATQVFDTGPWIQIFVMKDQTPILLLSLKKFLDGFQSSYIITTEQARGKNLALKIYQAVSSSYHKPIYSDTSQTDASRIGIWQKLIQTYPQRIVGYDQKTGEDLPLSSTPKGPSVKGNQPIYTPTKNSDRIPSEHVTSRTRLLKFKPIQSSS